MRLAASRLMDIPGIQLITHDEEGNQYGFSDFDGKFKGHYDGAIKGILEAPKTWHVWEHKEVNEKGFNKFHSIKNERGTKNTLEKWNERYYAQAQVYMHYTGMKRHFTTVSTMGGRDYQTCRTNYDKARAEEYIRKAQVIIDAQKPPAKISDRPDFYMCRWCAYKEECHG